MPAPLDLTGKVFGRLRVIERAGQAFYGGEPKRLWKCICTCGAERLVNTSQLTKGNTRSCGCLQRDTVISRNTKHGACKGKDGTGTYSSWCAMHTRCYNDKQPGYAQYGGRGIRVCERWHNYQAFEADMGKRPPGTSIDRIDPNGNYEPGNCRWATRQQQNINQRRIPKVLWNGAEVALADVCRQLGLNRRLLREQAKRLGGDLQAAFDEATRSAFRAAA